MSQHFEVGQRVRVVKAPREAPHLLGKVGKVVYAWKTNARVYIDGAFTDFNRDEVKPSAKK